MPPADRIATFGNDGTLWYEKPQYAQAEFIVRRWKAMAKADPAKAKEQPYKALAENDRAWLTNLLDHVPDLARPEGPARHPAGLTKAQPCGGSARSWPPASVRSM
jgi:hypothetical protein